MTLDFLQNELIQASDAKIKAQYEKSEPLVSAFGLRMGILRAIAKPLQGRQELSDALQTLPQLEALMLSNMIANPKLVDEEALNRRARRITSTMYVDQSLLDLVIQTNRGWVMAERWIVEPDEYLRYAGYQLIAALARQEELVKIPVEFLRARLENVKQTLRNETKLIAYAMNNFVVMAGLHVPALEQEARIVAEAIGFVEPLRAKNDCNTQSALDYLNRYGNDPKYSRTAKLKKGTS